MPRDAFACQGTPAPPMWGRSTVLGKVAPAVFALAGPGGPAVIPTVVFIGATGPPGLPCTPVSTTVTLSLTCVPPPPGPPGAVVGATVAFPTPAPGVYFIPVTIAIPPGPLRICALTGTATTTWANGATSTGAGDIEICITDPAPGEPPGGTPRLDLELLSPDARIKHPGDQAEHEYRITNNDPDESVTVMVMAESEQTARMPTAGGTPEPPGSGSGVFAIADPADGDNFNIAFSDELFPEPEPGNNYTFNDGTSEVAVGSTKGGMIWLNQFDAVAGQTIIDKVSTIFGPGSAGRHVQALLYADPDDDGDPTDAILLASADHVVGAVGVAEEVLIEPTDVGPPGSSFFAGFVMQESLGASPGAVDTDSAAGRSWFADDVECNADIEDLSNNLTPPIELSDGGLPGNWLIRCNGRAAVGLQGWVELPEDPTAFPPPLISRAITLCPGESRVINIATRSSPMCPPGSTCELRVKLEGTFSGGDDALACAASVTTADTSIGPDFQCPDGGMMTQVDIQPPAGIDFFGKMPSHDIHMSMQLLSINVVPLKGPPLTPLPPQLEILNANRGRISVQNVSGKGPAAFEEQPLDVSMIVSVESKLPDVNLELLDAHFHAPPKSLDPTYLIVGLHGKVTAPGLTVDSFFDTFYHVSLDGITGPFHHAGQIEPTSVELVVISPSEALLSFRGVFPTEPPLPPEIDAVQVMLDPTGNATGLVPAPPCPWDFDGDGGIGFSDLLEALSGWGPNPGHPADFDGDGVVGFSDLLKVLSVWGPCPG